MCVCDFKFGCVGLCVFVCLRVGWSVCDCKFGCVGLLVTVFVCLIVFVCDFRFMCVIMHIQRCMCLCVYGGVYIYVYLNTREPGLYKQKNL